MRKVRRQNLRFNWKEILPSIFLQNELVRLFIVITALEDCREPTASAQRARKVIVRLQTHASAQRARNVERVFSVGFQVWNLELKF